jgi:hypothetical protein
LAPPLAALESGGEPPTGIDWSSILAVIREPTDTPPGRCLEDGGATQESCGVDGVTLLFLSPTYP